MFADYVILMGYDEHYVGSEEAGSVASIGFVRQGVADTLQGVPANKRDSLLLVCRSILVYGVRLRFQRMVLP